MPRTELFVGASQGRNDGHLRYEGRTSTIYQPKKVAGHSSSHQPRLRPQCPSHGLAVNDRNCPLHVISGVV
jgi:hypothetical protein